MKILFNKNISFAVLILVCACIVVACGSKPPKQERSSAELAAIAAQKAEKCAPETYASAQKVLQKARRLTTEKKYDEARLHFKSAEKLFAQAIKEAKANKECMNEDQQQEEVEEELKIVEPPIDPEEAALKTADYQLEMIHFPFNSDIITDEAREILKKNARWMLNFPEAKVLIEGHCDNRGGMEFNLSLGERRASNVRGLLMTLGVMENNLEVISYGEERPLVDEDSEEAYARNRRTEFKKIWKN